MRGVLLAVAAVAGCGRIGFDELADASGPGDDATVYGELTDPVAWSSFDVTSVNAGASGYAGAAFDGRYAYFVPSYNSALHGIVARHDTQGSFTDAASWTTFDTASVDPLARGFDGGAFDGRYVYFVPHQNLAGFDGVVTRYDTQQPFTAPAAWTTFDTATVSANALGFYGAQFDGRYLYLVPYLHSVIARYDTQAAFSSPAAWTTFDLATVSNVSAFIGAGFDGRFLYLAPFMDATTSSGLVFRYDTQALLTAKSSWSTFDTTTVAPNARGFCGAAFDGRHLYLVPFASGPGVPGSTVTRYDTQATFTTASSWEIFDTSTSSPSATGLFGATFDGRFVYFAPYSGVAVARYDTASTFTDSAAWSTFDVTTVDPRDTAFYGAVFDGGAVYLVPHGGGTVARFAAKTPPSMPLLPGFSGSFF